MPAVFTEFDKPVKKLFVGKNKTEELTDRPGQNGQWNSE